jgi:hypothetical protein
MIARVGLIAFALAASASADLYLTTIGDDFMGATYYRLSTLDASVQLISQNPDDDSKAGLTLGPDGHHYATAIYDFDLVNPLNGWSQELFGCCEFFPTGALTAAPNGDLFIGNASVLPPLWVWNVYNGSLVDYIDFGEPYPLFVALQWRDDGMLVAFQKGPTVFEVDVASHTTTPIGEIDLAIGQVYALAEDPVSGRAYILAEDEAHVEAIYEFDLYTLETTLIGALPPELDAYAIAGIAICPADFNADGSLDILDFVDFQLAFVAGDHKADYNGDGVLDLLDFVAFQTLFQMGCE